MRNYTFILEKDTPRQGFYNIPQIEVTVSADNDYESLMVAYMFSDYCSKERSFIPYPEHTYKLVKVLTQEGKNLMSELELISISEFPREEAKTIFNFITRKESVPHKPLVTTLKY
jgi:hypothetical protein